MNNHYSSCGTSWAPSPTARNWFVQTTLVAPYFVRNTSSVTPYVVPPSPAGEGFLLVYAPQQCLPPRGRGTACGGRSLRDFKNCTNFIMHAVSFSRRSAPAPSRREPFYMLAHKLKNTHQSVGVGTKDEW